MAIRIAHLSDLHFGRNFDLALWRAVQNEVARFKPQLLIVSGDVVDHPSPIQLLAAKCELRTFAQEAGAKLLVVPGNHDVYRRGLYTPFWRRKTWFERIFFNDMTEAAETAAQLCYGAPLGFNETYRTPKWTARFREARRYTLRLPSSFRKHVPSFKNQEPVQRPENCSVLVAMLDSNKAGPRIGFATGEVDKDDLVALRDELAGVRTPYLLRVAVVHHHVLPIAFSGGRLIGAEPLMVLHNAGTVLALLTEHRFDLVLHGHKHVAQFARLDLSPTDEDGYPMAVASAGSAALPTTKNGNCFNLINVTDTGRLEVESFYYGNGRGPSRNGASGTYVVYREPLETVKRRAHIRALERHTISCENRTNLFEITETGDLLSVVTLTGLRANVVDHPHRREHRISLGRDMWFVDEFLKLDDSVSTHAVTFEQHSAADPISDGEPSNRQFTVKFPEGALNGKGIDYRVTFSLANFASMTRWECRERAGPDSASDDWDKGFVGLAITHPTERVTMTLKLPEPFREVRPFVRCSRIATYPDYEIDANGDAVFEHGWIPDRAMTRHETAGLHFVRESGLPWEEAGSEAVWQLELVRPVVGYHYQIMWATPGDKSDNWIRSEVLHQKELLLRRADGVGVFPADAVDHFSQLVHEIEQVFGRMSADEKRSVELFVYDSSKTALRPVLSRRSWTRTSTRSDFTIPLGRGIAGIAFQQRRTIPWAKKISSSPFVKPLPYTPREGEPAIEYNTMLAIPIFHSAKILAPQPPPWACIGVLSFGSDSHASRIPKLFTTDEKIVGDLAGVRALAHARMAAILECLEITRGEEIQVR